MKILFIIYLITILLGALGEFFVSAQIKDTIKNGNYIKVTNNSCSLRIASFLKLCVMPLIPLYNIILFIIGLVYTEEMCVEVIEESKIYAKKNE